MAPTKSSMALAATAAVAGLSTGNAFVTPAGSAISAP
eukprot:CAMPEP_0195060254 /NCGR_PEP_ID=MMETSP0448-20130528/7559_1 /TAXON_ID=66468 /ORGANISM="Heterocapsa triquestra, Strain CCMP 448" /LENGTH=36 /DNA_ID= /DNA_START= /DNA_END= /DNA_ORIENTATION=